LDLASLLAAAGQYDTAHQWLTRFEDASQGVAGDDSVQLARFRGIRAVFAFLVGDPVRAIEWGQEAIDSYEEDADDGYLNRLPMAIVRSFTWLGNLDAATTAFERSYPVPALPAELSKTIPAAALAQIHFNRGELRQAEALAKVALSDGSEPHPPGLTEAHLILGGVAWERGESAPAEAQFELALREAEQYHFVPFAILASLGLARLWHATDRREEAFDLLARGRHINHPRQLSRPFLAKIDLAVAELLLSEGNVVACRELLEGLPQSVETRLLHARAALVAGSLPRVEEMTRELQHLPLTSRQCLHLWLLDAQLGSASAGSSLEKALALAEKERFVRCFLDEQVEPNWLAAQPASRGHARFVELLRELGAMQLPLRVSPPEVREGLSEGEMRILRRLPEWRSNREIADELIVSVNTIKTHLKSIYRKLDVGSRSEAIKQARELGILS
jgi:LuxR family transcriptional regulator, maltose regulon positive regulatory protein